MGSCAAIVDLSIFFIFAKLSNFNYLFVSSVSFIITILVNYFLSIKFVFQTNIRFGTKSEVFLIYLISSVGIVLHLIILFLCIDQLFIEKMISKFIAITSVFIWNFTAKNYFVFKEKGLAG